MDKNNKNSNNSGFKVPVGYFEDFEKQLHNSLKEQTMKDFKILKNKQSGFKVPDQYFENFEEKLLDEIRKKNKTQKVISLSSVKRFIYFSGVAAMITLAIILWNSNNSNPIDFETLATSDIQEYIINGSIEVSDDELVALLDHEIDLIDTFEDTQINDQILEDYLLKEDLENDIYIE